MARRVQSGTLYRKARIANGKRVLSACWYGEFVQPGSRKRQRVKLFTDKAASRARLTELVTQAERRVVGLVDRFAEHRVRPVSEHLVEYLEWCRARQDARHVDIKELHLSRVVEGTKAVRLDDLELNRVERVLRSLVGAERGARTHNAHRASIVAFVNWCVETGRLPDNQLKRLPKLDETADQRRDRRALSADELSWFLDHAGPWRTLYLVAAYTGLRKGELGKIRWADLDLDAGTLLVGANVGRKAKRDDYLPLHRQVVDALRAWKGEASQGDRVFPKLPTWRRVQSDLKAARKAWIEQGASDEEREARTKSDFLALEDAAGRTLDFHSLRTTTGTMLARAGVTPQVARMVMRHADIKTTLKHYTDLRLHDAAKAVASLPPPGGTQGPQPMKATGTCAPGVGAPLGVVGAPQGSLRLTGSHNGKSPQGASPSTGGGENSSGNAGVCAARHEGSRAGGGKRAKGLEPSTFSLEG